MSLSLSRAIRCLSLTPTPHVTTALGKRTLGRVSSLHQGRKNFAIMAAQNSVGSYIGHVKKGVNEEFSSVDLFMLPEAPSVQESSTEAAAWSGDVLFVALTEDGGSAVAASALWRTERAPTWRAIMDRTA